MKKVKDKPLTLDVLADYNRRVMFPELKELFVTKDEFKEFKDEMRKFKGEFTKFKDESLSNQDATLKKLDILLQEKEVREYQEKKEKRMWLIIINALKEHKILTSKQLKQIAQLEIF